MKHLAVKPTVAITLGDAAGVGAEIVAKCAAAGVLQENAHAVIIADESEWLRGLSIAGVDVSYELSNLDEDFSHKDTIVVCDTAAFDAQKFPLGEASVGCGLNSAKNLETAISLMREGKAEAVCFGPNNKEMMKKAGYKLDGAIDLVAGFMSWGGERGEFSVLDDIWTARVTSHIPLMRVSDHLSIEKIFNKIMMLYHAKRSAGYENPRIAVAALNPHAGEGGTCGTEEVDLIQPAIDMAAREGVLAFGPIPADTMFYNLFRGEYDSAVTMYHDQGQIALKLHGFDSGATVMGGLPYPVTTCSHGTAYDVAGKGTANPGAWASAYRLAARMAQSKQKMCEKRKVK